MNELLNEQYQPLRKLNLEVLHKHHIVETAANINMNSRGSVTPVKKVATNVEINIDLYLGCLSLSTFLYIA